jgi:hypothetical protein
MNSSTAPHFSIDGDYLTNLVRSMWADDQNPEKALAVLESGFPEMPYSQRLSIVCGSKRLVGDEQGIELVDDDATHTEAGTLLSLASVLRSLRQAAEEGADALQLLSDTTIKVPSKRALVAIPLRRLRDYKAGKIDLEDMLYRQVSAWPPEVPTPRPAAPILEKEVEEDLPPAIPEAKITGDSGWLSPEGKFYPCRFMQHTALARALGHEDEQPLTRWGWVRLSMGHPPLPGDRPATQKQLDLLFDHLGKLPFWAEDQ